MAVTVDAQAQAAAGEGITIGRRAHTVRHGQGQTASTERLEMAGVGITGLTTDDQFGACASIRELYSPTEYTGILSMQLNR